MLTKNSLVGLNLLPETEYLQGTLFLLTQNTTKHDLLALTTATTAISTKEKSWSIIYSSHFLVFLIYGSYPCDDVEITLLFYRKTTTLTGETSLSH